MPTPVFLGEFEQLVLLSLLQEAGGIDGDAPVRSLLHRIEELAHRSISRGALYRTLDRLEEKGWVRWRLDDEDVAKRGGHPRRHFGVTNEGVEVLRASRATLLDLWAGLEDVFHEA
jgi:PadR family transcriptional regulator, regulatory protein PadR